MPRSACDLCYWKQEKCQLDVRANACRLCSHRGARCTFSRRQLRIGRPPATKTFPYGHCSIINLESNNSFGQPSQTIRSSLLLGPRTDAAAINHAEVPRHSPGRPQWSLNAERNQHLMRVLTDRNSFYDFHRLFLIGPSFVDKFQASVRMAIVSPPGMLFDAYQALLAWWDSQRQCVKSPNEFAMVEGRDCLESLQHTVSTARPEDMAAILMVGQVLVVYHVFATCTSARTITRHILLSTKRLFPGLLNEPRFDIFTVTPIFMDIVESLIRREIPAIRVSSTERFIVDKYAGICWSFLPLLQQLCEVSNQVKISTATGAGDNRGGLAANMGDQFSEIEHSIRCWQPNPPSSFFDDYTSLEVSAMLTQANVHRTAALLMIHRLRYALGVEDEVAQKLANIICSELTTFVSSVPGHMTGLPVVLPLLLAAMETRYVGQKLMRQLSQLTAHPLHAAELCRFVELAWAARERGFRGLWFELVESNLQLPILP